ncbi:MAG TPA: glycosyltransferase, partial [Thermoleophilaceae bacterium]|nr:glycosyltransferase [Thermoleophilaceae bacterium]
VAEAMWKARPVVASRIGGIQDQIVDGVSGMLIDPSDVAAYGDRVRRLAVLPTHVVNAADRRSVADPRVGPAFVVMAEPVWQRGVAMAV